MAYKAAGAAARARRVDKVQVDGLTLMKILKHARETPMHSASGPLLGLVVDGVLEVTNCFPYPAQEDDDGTGKFQIDMLRCLREVNVDHQQVGWYQSTFLGAHMDADLIQSQFAFQSETAESVVLIFDPERTAQGSLSLKAYRLTDKYMALHKDGVFSKAGFARHEVTHHTVFEEIPVVVRSSNLARVLLNDLFTEVEEDSDRLDLASSSYIEKNVKQLMVALDELTQDTMQQGNFVKTAMRHRNAQEMHLAKRRADKVAAGENPGNDREVAKELAAQNHPLFKPLQEPPAVDRVLADARLSHCSGNIAQFATANLGKLFLSQAVQDQ